MKLRKDGKRELLETFRNVLIKLNMNLLVCLQQELPSFSNYTIIFSQESIFLGYIILILMGKP